MDKVDKRILQILQENARTTISVMSSEVNLSMPAVSERLKKLEASGIIKQFTTIIDPKFLNKTMKALVFIGLDYPSKAKTFHKFVKNEPEITECFSVTGSYDYCMKVSTENPDTLQQLLDRIKENGGVTSTQTMVVLSTVIDKPSVTLD